MTTPTSVGNVSFPPVTSTQAFVCFLLVAAGFYWYVGLAWRQRKNSGRIKYFFLGGANLGPELTEHNTLGMTFAWSGGIWFFVTLAYKYGPWVTLLQVPWVLSVVFLGTIFGRILKAVRNRTIHGFLEQEYGRRVRNVAAVATTLGYVLNAGFELYWSGRLLAVSFGLPGLDLWVAVLLALVAAAYCYVGGYVANTTTDKPQNILGVLALATLVLFVVFGQPGEVPAALQVVAVLFAGVTLLYTVISYTIARTVSARNGQWQSVIAVAAAAVACVATIALTAVGRSQAAGSTGGLASSLPPLDLLIGVAVFQLFFNGVDMANWQQVAANGDAPESKYAERGWAIVRAALYLLWFPALGGVLLGVALKGLSGELTDDNLFQAAFGLVLPDASDMARGAVLGLLVLGLLSTTLSTADTYIMAAVHTLISDLLYPGPFRHAIESDTAETGGVLSDDALREQQELVRRARLLLVPLALAMALTFYTLYRLMPNNVFDFQTIMYSFAISLFAPVMVGLFRGRASVAHYSGGAFWGITAGVVAGIAPYITVVSLGLSPEERGPIVNFTPAFSLVVSTVVFFTLGFFQKRNSK